MKENKVKRTVNSNIRYRAEVSTLLHCTTSLVYERYQTSKDQTERVRIFDFDNDKHFLRNSKQRSVERYVLTVNI